jgi:hypothetical protein
MIATLQKMKMLIMSKTKLLSQLLFLGNLKRLRLRWSNKKKKNLLDTCITRDSG